MLCIGVPAYAAKLSPPELVFGMVPQQAAFKMARDWAPLLRELTALSGVSLRFATAPDIPTFEARLQAGEYDIAYMNPYHYTVVSDALGFRPLVKARDKRIEGIVVASKQRSLHGLEDLAGEQLAFPAPAAFAATLLTRGTLGVKGIPYQAVFVNSHDAVYRNVAAGRFIAGGGIQRTFDALEPRIREQLQVIWRSSGFTAHAIAAHPRVDAAVVAQLRAALVQLASTEAGAAALRPLKIKGFEVAVDSDWNDVRALHLQQVLGEREEIGE
ncbi:phosphate/phosphite/phosphonate ABC transporter substrate-binding protein [Amphritea sp. 1_MG-2023]|uniref:phosphate/phosphite/phosphonate ABC transporter substrate-binding protein n=1 Tax=Amphritea sp. 1_MG-2023 TaxID=3062670 RepID=UPI0026E16B99|nr:phosphate/phosphite/phosphonate ABC transporter substrate-binding protein [Amphritea sp. 1_MG-2023]